MCGQLLQPGVSDGQDVAAATRAICQRHPQVRVIALTPFSGEALVREALQAGASGYLLKDISADELATAIRTAHAGHATLSPEVAQTLAQAVAPHQVTT